MTISGEPDNPPEVSAQVTPQTATTHRPPRRRRVIILSVVAVAVLAVIVLAVALIAGLVGPSTAARPPRPGMPLLVAADTAAAAASASAQPGTDEAAAAKYLAARPAAVWLTPEHAGIGAVGAQVTGLLGEAHAAQAALTVVVYGLPGRDCGQYSAGGLQPGDYTTWTAEIGTALKAAPDVTTLVILEPDSLALAPQCGNIDARVAQLSAAIGDLTAPNTWIYLDGGHSTWLPADQMAGLLRQAGVDRVRGFATNVSNYNALGGEVAYAHAVSDLLGGAHAVIDTSRNGAGSDGQWCNPPARLTGETGATMGDEVVDLNLWIKPPGESDGTCNGGPAAGTWWPQSAVELTRNAPR